MFVPLGWLRELVPEAPAMPAAKVAEALVGVGLEEEGMTGGDVTGPLVVGRVLTKTPEPQTNGKTINWCMVDVGEANGTGDPQGIVCGADNFTEGDLVPVILPGGVLPGGFSISARKTYGHVSAGMICSARELGLGDDHAGIIVLSEYLSASTDVVSSLDVGDDLIPVLGLDDEVLEVNVTPDRGYCFSMRGIAREFALATGVGFEDPAVGLPATPSPGGGYAVRLSDDSPIDGIIGCDRYVARSLRGVDPGALSPPWMRERLRAVGMRPISLAVDVTNYVMMLLGQPLHAFDLATLGGEIVVRRARAGERLTTLDGVDRALDAEDLLITDNGEVVLGLAGVMGGRSSEVSATTSDILIEAAHFDPVTVARTSRRHRLSSEASKRFERGVDPDLPGVAAALAAHLIAEFGGGIVSGSVTDVDARRPRQPFAFSTGLPTQVVGLAYPREEVVATLRAIGCEVIGDGEMVSVLPPSWRPDLVDGPDLVEEVARVRGYGEIPSVVAQHGGAGLSEPQRARRAIAVTLAHQGLVEVLSYPFVSGELFDTLGYASDDPRRRTVRLVNPWSDEAPLIRTSVLDSLLETLRRNISRGMRDIAVYELGRVTAGTGIGTAPTPPIGLRPDDATLARILAAVPPQPYHLAYAGAGEADAAGPFGPARRFEASDAVAWGLAAAASIGVDLSVAAADRPPWHPGRCARFMLADATVVGHAGELHPKVLARLDLPARTIAGELDLDLLTAAARTTQAAPLSTYPLATTDVALVVDEAVPAGDVEAALRAGAGTQLEALSLFDIYRGEQLGEGRKSLAYRITVRAADRTLTTQEVSDIRDRAIAAAAKATGAAQRGIPRSSPPAP